MDERDQRRFWSKVDTSAGFLECWPWVGKPDTFGYGHMSIGNVPTRTHRIAYELVKGPIPAGLTIDHLCRNRVCANPGHLEAVTRGENVRRGAPFRAKKPTCPAGHPRVEGARTCSLCHRERTHEWYARKHPGAVRYRTGQKRARR